MKRKVVEILFLFVMIITIMVSSSFAYSDDLFKFDLPSSYTNVTYQGMYVFSDTNNKDRGVVIYAKENRDIKKSVWDIDQSDLKDVIRSLSYGANVVKTEKRAKLGKEKAVEVILSEDGDYMDMYILASNKYIYMVIFTGTSQAELENSDYNMIKDSFKLKDATTNFRLLYILGVIIVIAIGAFVKYRKNIAPNYDNYHKVNTVDYKNLTEDDFKNM